MEGTIDYKEIKDLGLAASLANVWHYPGANSFARCGEEGNLSARFRQ